ncbi:MAG: hypothetical protein OXB86_04235 [Bdellovibrionales bacterium]|nr:hypothetical protein [Bdellovibrionales bacterium]
MKKLSLLLFFLFSQFAISLERTGFHSSLPHLSYSGAGGGSLKSDFSYLINPALLGYARNQQALLAYSFKSHWQTALFSFMDRSAGIPMSVTFQREWYSQGKYKPLNRWSASAGTRISPVFSLGVTARRAKDKEGKNRWNGDMGALFLLTSQTTLGVTLSEILVYESRNQRTLNFGFYQGWSHFFSGRVDASFSRKQEWIIRGGIETLFQKFFAVRVGGLWSFKEKKALFSGGVGFFGPRLQFDYALQKDQKIFQHIVMAKLFF